MSEENPYFRPFGSRVLVEVESVKSEVIITPDAYKKSMEKAIGRISAVGPDCVDLKVGMRVVLSKYAGVDIAIEEIAYRILSEGDIHGELLFEEDVSTEGRFDEGA